MYTTVAKAKEIEGKISSFDSEAIKDSGLDGKHPFAGIDHHSIRFAFFCTSAKLFQDEKIGAAYSVHDIRHWHGINEYRKDKDIYRLKVLLNHSSDGELFARSRIETRCRG